MFSFTSYAVLFVIARSLANASPIRIAQDRVLLKQDTQRRGFEIPFKRQVVKRDGEAGAVGLGDFADLFYTVAIQVGDTTTAVNLDTGSSDLWVKGDECTSSVCQSSTSTAYTQSSTFQDTGADVDLQYGDSTTGTFASGPVGLETVTLAGLTLQNQPFAVANDTDSTAVSSTAAGIIGLGFPSQSFVEAAVVNAQFDTPSTTDEFVSHMTSLGPLVSRLAANGVIDQPLFAITLQRDTIEVGGHGSISIGQLPSGVDNSSLTWVPVRLYAPADGGLDPPTFASDETYPLRWEVPIDAVFLDGKKLPNSNERGNGVSTNIVSALIDTGNSLIRGPQDVVNNVLSTVSPAFAANPNASPTYPCSTAHTLAFQIGGQMFPVNPLDFVAQSSDDDATTCVASNIVSTDPPSSGALFEWSLGDPFLKSTLVAFYYGNLTNPSQDPPRIGFLSTVPANASAVYESEVSDAQADGGVFSSTVDAAPTASTVVDVASELSPTPSPTSTGTGTVFNSVVQTTEAVGASDASSSPNEAATTTQSTSPADSTNAAQVQFTSTSTFYSTVMASPPTTSPSPTNSASSTRRIFSGLWSVLVPAIPIMLYFVS